MTNDNRIAIVAAKTGVHVATVRLVLEASDALDNELDGRLASTS